MLRVRGLAFDPTAGPEDLDLDLPRGATLLVTGPGGSGKSRLLKAVAGMERPARGEVQVGGIQVWPGGGVLALAGRLRMGFAFASGGLLSNLSLRDNVALPLRFGGADRGAVQARVEEALERLDLRSVAHLRPHAVSGSARRHANLARLLALDPELLLLDDPLEGLDAPDRAVVREIVAGWARDPGRTLVVAGDASVLTGGEALRLDLHAPLPTPEAP